MSNTIKHNKYKDTHLISLTILWGLSILFVGYSGNFPLNDDWAYAQNVYQLTEEGRIYFSNWPAMTLIGQTLWGALFCKIFGFSFTVLRFSTLLVSWITIISSYFLFCRLSSQKSLAFWAALLLASNPLFFSLSFTFMTDIHFLCCSVLSIFFYIRHHQEAKKRDWILATFFVVWAVLIRQMGILLPLLYSVHLLYTQGRKFSVLLKASVPLVVAIGTLVLYTVWRGAYYGFPPQYGNLSLLFYPLKHSEFYRNLLIRPGILFAYLGIFWLPIVLIQLPQLWKQSQKLQRILAISLSILLLIIFYKAWSFIPHGNVFYNLGLGPQVLKDTYDHINIPVQLSLLALRLLKLLIVGAGSLLSVFLFLKYLPKKENNYTSLQLGSTLMIMVYSFYLMLDGHFFDRYYLFLFPLMGILILPTKKLNYSSWALGLAVLFQIGYGTFSLLATHDYLSWNRARWKALDYLTEDEGVLPSQIDGGFEFNGWHQTSTEKNPPTKEHISWWFVDKDEYTITKGPLPFYETYNSVAYWQWLKMDTDSIFVLTKARPYQIDTIFSDLATIDTSNSFITTVDSILLEGGSLIDSTTGFTDQRSIRLTPDSAFALTYQFKNVRAPEKWSIYIWRKSPNDEGGIVLSAPNSEVFYQFEKTVLKDSLGWKLIELQADINTSYTSDIINFYIWNNGKATLWFDNLEIIRKIY
ncbi:MAG: glycosyltransferase family 39 protein [Aureispira sp.]|nr:glycosyltransferase family 39 protein [Aureispira sp.]